MIKPGQLVKLRPDTGLLWVWTTDIHSGYRFSFCHGEIGMYLNWGGSMNNGAIQIAHVLIGDRKVAVDEKYIEPVNC